MSETIITHTDGGATVVSHTYPADVQVAVVIDCSGPSDDWSHLQSLIGQAAMAAEAGDILSVDALAADVRSLLASGAPTPPPPPAVRPLTADELAARHGDAQEDGAQRAAATAHAFAALVAKCDRYLAQTDWVTLPASSRPVDFSKSLADKLDLNHDAWVTWRQAVRDLRAAAALQSANLSKPFPEQPGDPPVVLT